MSTINQSKAKALRHDIFVEETLKAEKELEEGGGFGPFDTVKEAMNHLIGRDEVY